MYIVFIPINVIVEIMYLLSRMESCKNRVENGRSISNAEKLGISFCLEIYFTFNFPFWGIPGPNLVGQNKWPKKWISSQQTN